MKKLIGVDFNKFPWSRYLESRRKVAKFIKNKYKKSDVKLKQLDLKFIKDLEYYWKTTYKRTLLACTRTRNTKELLYI